MGGLHAWHRDPNSNLTGSLDLPLPIIRAIHSQNTIGWFSLLNEFVSKEWIAIQDRHYTSITSRRTGRGWAIDFIQELWSISFALWMHRNDRLHNTKHCKTDRLRHMDRNSAHPDLLTMRKRILSWKGHTDDTLYAFCKVRSPLPRIAHYNIEMDHLAD